MIFFRRKREQKPKRKEELPKKLVLPKEGALGDQKVTKKGSSLAPFILKAPHLTEKASSKVLQDQYSFKVFKNANKTEVKKAIENLYGVNVLKVRIINLPKKRKRLGQIEGWRPGYKKAIVKIKKGQKIEILPR